VGSFYLDGDGTSIDISEAIKYSERAHEKQITQQAGYTLGRAYERSGRYQNFKKSYEYYESAPNGKSFYKLGHFNEFGKGCEIDLLKAKDFYTKASDFGIYGAKLTLAIWALLGVNQPEDLVKAEELLSDIPFNHSESSKKLKMLVYIEMKYANRNNDRQILSEVDNSELAFTCSSYCWDLLNYISNLQSIYSENICHLLCERGFRWFLLGLRSVGSKPKIYSKELVGREASNHLYKITKKLGIGLSYNDAYDLALEFYELGYESECIPVFMALAMAGMPFPQFVISQYYKSGKYIPTNYLNSYAWLNLASSKLENTTIRDGLKELEDLLGSQNIIQAQILSQQYQERFDPSLIGDLSAHKFNVLNSQELLILSAFDLKNDPPILGHFVNNAFNSPIFNSEDTIETKNTNKSIFLTLLKFFLLLPIAALCAYLIYIFGSGLLTYLLVKI
jgi:TPR repeat protein